MYDFVLALVNCDKFNINTLINDEDLATFRQLEWNPNSEFLIAYEVNQKAMLHNINSSLHPNWLPSQEPFAQSQPTTSPLKLEHQASMSLTSSKKQAKDDLHKLKLLSKNKLT